MIRKYPFGIEHAFVQAWEAFPDDPRWRPGTTLVFLHGRIGHSGIWKSIIAKMSQQFRCIAIDFPGHGASFSVQNLGKGVHHLSSMVTELLKSLHATGPCAWIGHDLGCAVAQLCALERGMNEPFFWMSPLSLLDPYRRLPQGVGKWRIQRSLKKFLSEGLPIQCATYPIEYLWPGLEERKRYREALRSRKHPTVMFNAAQDPLGAQRSIREILEYLPESYSIESQGTSPWIMLENPEWISDKIVEFLFRFSQSQSSQRGKMERLGFVG